MISWQVANVSSIVKVLFLVLLLTFFLSSISIEHAVSVYLTIIHLLAILVTTQEVVVYLLVWINAILSTIVLLTILVVVHFSLTVIILHLIIVQLSVVVVCVRVHFNSIGI